MTAAYSDATEAADMATSLNPDTLLIEANAAMMRRLAALVNAGRCVHCARPSRGLCCERPECWQGWRWLAEPQRDYLAKLYDYGPPAAVAVKARGAWVRRGRLALRGLGIAAAVLLSCATPGVLVMLLLAGEGP